MEDRVRPLTVSGQLVTKNGKGMEHPKKSSESIKLSLLLSVVYSVAALSSYNDILWYVIWKCRNGPMVYNMILYVPRFCTESRKRNSRIQAFWRHRRCNPNTLYYDYERGREIHRSDGETSLGLECAAARWFD